MRLTKEDIEWLDRIGVDSRRMKIIKRNQDKAERYVKIVEKCLNAEQENEQIKFVLDQCKELIETYEDTIEEQNKKLDKRSIT